jgi:hypothetical protein
MTRETRVTVARPHWQFRVTVSGGPPAPPGAAARRPGVQKENSESNHIKNPNESTV